MFTSRYFKGKELNFLDVLKEAEPNVSQISRDAGVSRQAVYLWTDGHMPSKDLFDKLSEMDKYAPVLESVEHVPLKVGRPVKK